MLHSDEKCAISLRSQVSAGFNPLRVNHVSTIAGLLDATNEHEFDIERFILGYSDEWTIVYSYLRYLQFRRILNNFEDNYNPQPQIMAHVPLWLIGGLTK